ncbi:MAG: peptidoglycan-binding protein [Actinomycetes bacterium]|nr:peptidoglycan-binding protein [Actinomycetes bacterium]
MKPVQIGDRGAAVADIQRRLRMLGHDLGPTGVDGVFLQHTAAAVTAFQQTHGIAATGMVGPRTWSALVDATFTLGDRMLYLRVPFFHGADVTELQQALSSLGFSTGVADGIFGSWTERAVIEFQKNAGIDGDGVMGPAAFRALFALRHIWQGRAGGAHSAATAGAGAYTAVLRRLDLRFVAAVEVCERLARRANNLVAAAVAAGVADGTDADSGANVQAHDAAGRTPPDNHNSGEAGTGPGQPRALLLTLTTREADLDYVRDAGQLAKRLSGVVSARCAPLQNSNGTAGPARVALSVRFDENLLVAGAVPGPQHHAKVLLDAVCVTFS